MRRILLSLLAVLGTAFLASAENVPFRKCKALVMSGGANKGAYEAGVVHGLSRLLNGTDAYYDVVSGVSAGALNSAAMAYWAPETAVDMSEWLVNFWKNTSDEMIYQEWPGGLEQGFYNESGIYDTSPLLNTLITVSAQLGGQIRRKIVVASVDSNNGEYVVYSEKNTPLEELPQRFLASASVPFVFPSQLINGRTMMDGGTVWNTNLASAVERCREMVDRDEDIIMDVVVCSNSKLQSINATGDTIENFLRSWDVSGYHTDLGDVREFRRALPNITYRYFFQASKPLASGLQLLDFSPAIIWPMIDTGKEDAVTIVTTTKPGESFKFLDDWVDSAKLQEEYPIFAHYLYATKGAERQETI